MAINLATKYSSKVDEVIKNGALSAPSINNDYDWTGAQTVKVYSFDPVAMNNYNRSGANRYGTPNELPDTTQEMTLSQDKSFTFTIDKGNKIDTPDGVSDAASALRRQIDLVVQPEIDKYRFTKIAEGAAHKFFNTGESVNAYSLFLEANQAISDADIPTTGRIANVSPTFLTALKKDSNFIQASDMAQNMLIKGAVGEVDGVQIIPVPSMRLPAGCLFEITHSMACVGPVKLEDYKIHQDPPGISGMLCEGRIYYDAFVLGKKADMIAVCYGKVGSLTVTAKAGADATHSVIKVTGNTSGGTLVYKGDYANESTAKTAIATGSSTSNWTAVPSTGIVTTASGKYIAVAVAVDNKVVSGGTVAAAVGS